MIKRIIFIFIVATISYYAGSQGLKIDDIINFFEDRNVGQRTKAILKKSINIVHEKNLDKKTEEVTEIIKNKVKNLE
tara:strand:+ start:140 stop:370 length:231 start_codon:yes stop_codon:yes gene_type:complete